MFPTSSAVTQHVTLVEVIDRLRQRNEVAGILLMGSVVTGQLTLKSDYDILLVLDHLSTPTKLITTWIEGRFAEIYCTTMAAIERVIAEPELWEAGSEEEALIRWLRDGQVRHDRTGVLQRGQDISRTAPAAVADDVTIYRGWWGIGYNATHLRRYASSNDPVGQAAANVKLLFCLFQVIAHYFTMRRLPWRGEKAAMRYLTEHDPGYFALLQRCFAELDLNRKIELYEKLAARTVAPVGNFWSREQSATAIELGWGFGTGQPPLGGEVEEMAAASLNWWRRLIEHPSV